MGLAVTVQWQGCFKPLQPIPLKKSAPAVIGPVGGHSRHSRTVGPIRDKSRTLPLIAAHERQTL